MIEVVFFGFVSLRQNAFIILLKIALSAIFAFGLNYMNKECLQKRIKMNKYNYMVVLTGSVFYCNYYYVR